MNNLKKSVAVLAAAAILTVPMAASANGNANINVSATVKPMPQANMTVNFDGLNFIGTVGDTAVPATYTKGGAAGSNTINLTARNNYSLLVSGNRLFTLPGDPMMPAPMVDLDSKRIKVAVPTTGTLISLTSTSTLIDQGVGEAIKTSKALNFTLDLSRPVPPATTPDPAAYTDYGFEQLETKETSLFANVTLSFTSL